jgi:hypothetical protein
VHDHAILKVSNIESLKNEKNKESSCYIILGVVSNILYSLIIPNGFTHFYNIFETFSYNYHIEN